jgi:hypothetical protein
VVDARNKVVGIVTWRDMLKLMGEMARLSSVA